MAFLCFYSRCVHFWSKNWSIVVWLVIFFSLPNNRQQVHAFIYGWLYCLRQVARELQPPLQPLSTLEKCVQNGPRFSWNGSWSFAFLVRSSVCWFALWIWTFGMKAGHDSNPHFSPTGWNAGLVGLMLVQVVEWMSSHRIDSPWHLLTEEKILSVFQYHQYHWRLCAPITGTNMLHRWAIFLWYKLCLRLVYFYKYFHI